jgi:hypothetical protein
MLLLDAWTTKDTTTLLLGFLLGGGASFCAWWLVTHGIVPSLAFSPTISKVSKREDPARSSYRFKFKNSGRRAIIDVELFARLYAKLSPTATTYQVIPIALSQTRFPILRARGRDKLISILPAESQHFGRANYPEAIRAAYTSGSLTLEQIMSMDGEVELQVICFGFDSFSGARKLWQVTYKVDSIKEGAFKKTSFDITPPPIGPAQDTAPAAAPGTSPSDGTGTG